MTIVIAAGGTGGHLYPAVALAREFLRRDPRTKVLFVGTARGLESKVLAHEGFDLALISARPVMGKGLFGALTGLCALPVSLRQCLRILRARQADLVIGVGGYTSPMMLLAAALVGVTRVILEPNAHPGMANKAVGPFAQRVFLAFESAADSFDRSKVRVVGTPIRKAFLEGIEQRSEEVRIGPSADFRRKSGGQGDEYSGDGRTTRLDDAAATSHSDPPDRRVRPCAGGRGLSSRRHRVACHAVYLRYAFGATSRRIWSWREPAP